MKPKRYKSQRFVWLAASTSLIKNLSYSNLFKNMGLRLETVDEKDQLIIHDSNSLHAFAINSDYGDYFTSNMLWDKMGAD